MVNKVGRLRPCADSFPGLTQPGIPKSRLPLCFLYGQRIKPCALLMNKDYRVSMFAKLSVEKIKVKR
jgi:hypothetical protein